MNTRATSSTLLPTALAGALGSVLMLAAIWWTVPAEAGATVTPTEIQQRG